MSMSDHISALTAENAARVNAELAAAGLCFMHNPEDGRRATAIIRVPIGNELPLCSECWAWWQGTIADPATADPHNVPEWVRGVDETPR
jgi:hypothetical protein